LPSPVPSPASPPSPTRPLHLGPGGRLELRPAEYRLLIDGQPAPLGGRALDLLIALAARPGELHTKSELLDAVWPGLVVEEGNLRVQINALRRVLGEEAIATVPGRGYRLSLAVQGDALTDTVTSPAPSSLLATSPARPHQAGEPRLFGRDADLAALEAALHEPACIVTLVGTPGVGKSSLARAALARWPGRSAWVDLAPLTQDGQVPGAIARALQAHLGDGDPAAQLPRLQPAGEPLLLVLDNAEHLIEACADWALSQRGAPPLRLLVTSQLPLRLAGERLLRLEPLPVPDANLAPVRAAEADDGALGLLIDRITAADSRYRPAPETLPLLAAICRQLDGLPLALEMAAARIPLMGVQAVHEALVERFALLSRGRRDAPARHRTLHAALDWSYGLLSPGEQGLFRALGVFAGGFTLDLAVTLLSDEHVGRWDVVDGLATLVERSLVTVSGTEPPRYGLLETMRAFALAPTALPVDADERASLRRRHAAAVLGLFSGDAPETQRLAEMENAREAFVWARENDLAVAAQLSARVARVIGFTVWRQEVTEWMLSLQAPMTQPAGEALPRETQANWWSLLAYVLNVRRDAAARPAAARAVALWRPLGNPRQLIGALGHWVRAIPEAGPDLDEACAELQQVLAAAPSPDDQARVQGALAEAARLRGDTLALLACREEELRLSLQLGWPDMAQAAESNVCAALIELGRHDEAAERGLALLERIDAHDGDSNGNLPWALNAVVEALTALGRLDQARALVPRSLAAGQRFGTTVAWQGILALALAQGRPRTAARLAGFVRQQWAASRATPDRDEQRRVAQCQAAVELTLGRASATAWMADGRSMSHATAAVLAGGQTDGLTSPISPA
jgi:predicted ATPase/DNA-binding winged helix-turn-helix (wHTH) protein